MELRGHALRYPNCWPLWSDEEVRELILDAIQATDPEAGKSLYVEDPPPPNHPSVRTAAFGILVELSLDETVREEMAQNELLRESIVEALRPEQVSPSREGSPAGESSLDLSSPRTEGSRRGGSRPTSPTLTSAGGEDEVDLTTPVSVQSRAQQLLAMLLPSRACAKALLRPAQPIEDEDEFVWVEESEEEEIWEDDPVVEPSEIEQATDPGGQSPEAQASGVLQGSGEVPADAESEADADALLAEVENILHAKKPSSDEDLLDALASAAYPQELADLQELDLQPPWRPGAALSRRLDTLWSLAATSDNAENSQLCRFEKVKDALLFGADVTQPDSVRISALGTMAALLARDENKELMWQDPEVRKVLVLGAADQISAPVEGETDSKLLRPQRTEVRLQAITALAMLAECTELREEIWKDPRVAASLQNAVEKPGPLRKVALQVLQHLSQALGNREDMVNTGIPDLIDSVGPDLEKHDKRLHRACEITRDRLLAAAWKLHATHCSGKKMKGAGAY